MRDNPILNSPYDEPRLHYATAFDGSLDYSIIKKGRRPFDAEQQAIPTRQPAQRTMTFFSERDEASERHIINLCRKEIDKWRVEKYPDITRVTKELLDFWFDNHERIAVKKLFFAQRETVETAIWLNEVAENPTPVRIS